MKLFWESFVQFYRRTDRLLFLLCLAASGLSAFFLYGIYLSGFLKLRVLQVQLLAILLGVLAAAVISLFDYRMLAGLYKIYLPFSGGLMLLTYLFGEQRYSYVDDKAWLRIPFVGLTIQPSEILKLAFIYSFALHLEKLHGAVNQPRNLALLCLHGAIPTLMVVAQGDHGTAMVFLFIFATMLFAAGLDFRYVAGAIGAAVVISPLLWFFVLDADKKFRILTIFHPDLDPAGKGWQQILGLTAIGSGQIWGKGVLAGGHQYVPEMYNDFIFSFAGESIGFVGCMGLLVLFGGICLSLLLNARRALDPLGSLICVGVFGMIAFQTVWSIGMALSLLPVAGLPLPFLSSGGTSSVLTWVGIGMVLGVHRHSHVRLFDRL